MAPEVAPLRRIARALGVSRRGRTFSSAQADDLAILSAEVRESRAAVELVAQEVFELITPLLEPAASTEATSVLTPDGYVASGQDPQLLLDLFRGEWASRLPAPHAELSAGSALLFEDERITWALTVLGPVQGQRVLELGPLECGHTWMLDRAGASEVVALEGNRRAYLKCLVVRAPWDHRCPPAAG